MPSTQAPTLVRETTDPYVLTAQESCRLLHGAPWARFTVIGDSAAEGLVAPVDGYHGRNWPDRLAAALRAVRPDLAYLNLGRRSLIAAQVRARQLEPALQFRPDLAAVLVGGYDLLRSSFDIDAVEIELARVIAALRDIGCTVVTRGLLDITRMARMEKYRALLRGRIALLAERTQSVSARLGALYLDLPAHLAGVEDIYSPDRLCLNARGHAIVAAEMVRGLGRHLGNHVPPGGSGPRCWTGMTETRQRGAPDPARVGWSPAPEGGEGGR